MTVALVTGASRGIGRAIAIELGARGHAVVVNYRADEAAAMATVAEIVEAGGRAQAVRADVDRCRRRSRPMFAAADALGALDVLVCNAGITRDTLLGASAPADFTDVLATNLDGVVHCCREATRRMMQPARAARSSRSRRSRRSARAAVRATTPRARARSRRSRARSPSSSHRGGSASTRWRPASSRPR